MKKRHIILMAFIIFCWIWSLPLLLIAFVFAIPSAMVLLPLSIALSCTLQYYYHDVVIPNGQLRRIMNRIPWSQWFPCNQINIPETSIIAVHPHGLLCCGALAGIHFIPGSDTVFCVAPILFYVPVIGWCLRLIGFIPAKYDIMFKTLQNGHSVIVVPGGVPEIVLAETRDDSQRFERHGFLKLARKACIPVISIFVQNECKIFNMITLPFLHQRVALSYYLNIPIVVPVFFGYYGTWLPKRIPLTLIHWKSPFDKNNYKRLFQDKVFDTLIK
jgi:hypothetical protein